MHLRDGPLHEFSSQTQAPPKVCLSTGVINGKAVSPWPLRPNEAVAFEIWLGYQPAGYQSIIQFSDTRLPRNWALDDSDDETAPCSPVG